jgi:NAD(P)-dependent dehydrogenase (short-subunit alcohol dehydrogenase family)
MASKKAVVVTGASQGIGAAVVQAITGESLHVDDGAHVGRWKAVKVCS